MSDYSWIDATVLGKPFEIQYNTAAGDFRHREMHIPPSAPGALGFGIAENRFQHLESRGVGEWVHGHPDDRKGQADE